MVDFIEYIKAFIIGIIQGITEWLPVSSTGHMILFDEFFKMNVGADFFEMFLVVIQFGSILAVVVLFFNKLNPFSGKKSKQEKTATWKLWLKVIVAIIPSGITGVLLDDWFESHFYNYKVVSIALIVYGVAFILIEYLKKNEIPVGSVDEITYGKALGMGAFQILALIPGTSRSGSTILGGMMLGLSRTAAAEFSFFMAIPTMLGASVIKGGKYALKVLGGETVMTGSEIIILLIGCVVAFAVSLFAIKFLMDFVKKHTFKAFGIYRIALGAAVLLYFLIAG